MSEPNTTQPVSQHPGSLNVRNLSATRRHDLGDDLGALVRFTAAALRRIDAGEGDLVELHRLAEINRTVAVVRDRLARRLLASDASQREIAAAIGVTRSAVAQRFSGVSSRRQGGQPSDLR
jgi:hypothetical protein